MWVGTASNLQKLAKTMGVLLNERKTSLLEEYDHETERLIEAEGDDAYGRKWRAERRAGGRTDLENAYLEVTLKDGEDEIRGPLDQAFLEFDRRLHKEIGIRVRFWDYDREVFAVSITPEEFRRGVHLELKSRHEGWLRHATSRISDEIDLCSPWWGRFHDGGWLIGLWSFIFLVLVIAMMIPLGPHLTENTAPNAATLAGAFSAGLTSLLTMDKVRMIYLPVVEILGEGESSRGTRFLLFLAGLGVSVAVGILINILTG